MWLPATLLVRSWKLTPWTVMFGIVAEAELVSNQSAAAWLPASQLWTLPPMIAMYEPPFISELLVVSMLRNVRCEGAAGGEFQA